MSGDPVHDRVLRAFAQGCDGELVEGWDYKPSKIAVIFGVRKSRVPKSFPRGEIFQRQRQKNLDVVVLETGYINRGDGENHHYAAGFNGLNGRADFRNEGMSPDRAEKLGVVLKPYRDGETVLLCGQVPWDASVDHVDYVSWLKAAIERIRAYSQRRIVFRPHPMAINALPVLQDVEYSIAPIQKDFQNAHAVVAFNSNSGVEALLNGIPAFAGDHGAMYWRLANKSLISIDAPSRPERQQWLNDLCYTQWTLEEMKSGEAWRHLSR